MADPRSFINSLPGIGGIMSSLWGDPSQEAVQRAYEKAMKEMAMQRADTMQGRTNAMNQSAMAFGPLNNMVGQMMGGQGPAIDFAPMLQNPMPQNQQNRIREAAFGSAPPSQPPPGFQRQGPYGGGSY